MNKILNIFIKFLRNFPEYILVFIGSCIFIWVIWIRFIRERLPREIPLDLTEFGFFILFFVCCIYLYIILNLIRPREINQYISNFVTYIYIPLKAFNTFIRNYKYLSSIDSKLMSYIMDRTDYQQPFKCLSNKQMDYIYLFYTIIPRIFMLIFLFIDVFYIGKLHLFYMVIIFGIFPLIHRYFKFYLENLKQEWIDHISKQLKCSEIIIYQKNINNSYPWNPQDREDSIYRTIYQGDFISIEDYVQIQVKTFYENSDDTEDENNIYYRGEPFPVIDYMDEYKKENNIDKDTDLTAEDYDNIQIEIEFITNVPIKLEIFLVSYRMSEKKYKKTKIIIYSLYFICWFYILIISYSKVKEFKFFNFSLSILIELLNKIIICIYPYIENIEPFSGINL